MNSNQREIVCGNWILFRDGSARIGFGFFLARAVVVVEAGGKARAFTHSQPNTNDTEKIERVF